MISSVLGKWCRDNDVEINSEQLEHFEKYAALLKEWNKKMNLTAIDDDEGIAIKHFIDSISLLKFADIRGKIIDIGTGAGFPGIPLKIMRPKIELTLLDSLNKRLIFLEEVCRQLSTDAELLHSRAEDAAVKSEYREKYDIAVSRAVANLPALCEYCIPYVKCGGMFISMKGPDGKNELAASENAIRLLGGGRNKVEFLSLPDGSSRTVISVSKLRSTPTKYPRRGQKINKNPL